MYRRDRALAKEDRQREAGRASSQISVLKRGEPLPLAEPLPAPEPVGTQPTLSTPDEPLPECLAQLNSAVADYSSSVNLLVPRRKAARQIFARQLPANRPQPPPSSRRPDPIKVIEREL